MLELTFSPDRRGAEPLYHQLESYLRDLIEARRLVAGERLPASRELASSLGLSRNTVNQAYQALCDDGLLRSHVGQGTFVAGAPLQSGARPRLREAGPAPRGLVWGGLFARRTRAVTLPPALTGPQLGDTPRFDFRGGQVDLDTLPGADLKRAFARSIDRHLPEIAADTDPRGWQPLREAVARGLVARGITCNAEDVAITNGAQQALDVLARVLVDPGDTVAVEQPGYFGATLAFAASEAHLVGVGVDGQGLRTDELARILRARRVKLVYTTPAVQSPTGVRMSESRRRELLELADTYQVPIIEDDYDSELRLGGPPVPALKNLDDGGRVIYVGTFSKALFAGLRVGYVVAPQPLLWRLVLSRWAADFRTDAVVQAALAELLNGGALERHVRRVRRLYADRCQALLAALAAHGPEGAHWVGPAGGNTIWLTLPSDLDAGALSAELQSAGVACVRGDAFFFDGRGTENLCLSFARLAASEMDGAIAELAACVARVRNAGRRSA